MRLSHFPRRWTTLRHIWKGSGYTSLDYSTRGLSFQVVVDNKMDRLGWKQNHSMHCFSRQELFDWKHIVKGRCITSQSEQQHYKQNLPDENITTNRFKEEEKSLVLVPGQEEKEEETEKPSLRDRIFSRFSGSTFMKQALYAKERIAERVDESDNPIILFVRNVYDRLFGETEMGQVIREIRQVDPQFTLSEFVRQIERETAPRILNAYLRGDRETLGALCTEDAYRALSASIREREAAGLVVSKRSSLSFFVPI